MIEVHAPLRRHSFQPATVNHIPPLVALGLYRQNKRAYTVYIYNRFSPLVISACQRVNRKQQGQTTVPVSSQAMCGYTLCTFQIRKHPRPLFQNCSCCHSQGVGHLQPFHLCNHSLKIQVSASIELLSNLRLNIRREFCRQNTIFVNRDTLAEKVPCLHFLSQAPRRDCISASHSDSSCRDPVLSRQVSKTKFQRVSSMSTTDTVSLACDPCFEDVLFDSSRAAVWSLKHGL